nr:hypothetical protein [Vibrio vulnificus]
MIVVCGKLVYATFTP